MKVEDLEEKRSSKNSTTGCFNSWTNRRKKQKNL